MGIFELKCEECGNSINNVNVYVMEENKYQVSILSGFGMKPEYKWSKPKPIEGGELYFDMECPICVKLIKRFAKSEDLEEYLKINSVEANRS